MTGPALSEHPVHQSIAFIRWRLEISGACFDAGERSLSFSPDLGIGLGVCISIHPEGALRGFTIIGPPPDYIFRVNYSGRVFPSLQKLRSFGVALRDGMRIDEIVEPERRFRLTVPVGFENLTHRPNTTTE